MGITTPSLELPSIPGLGALLLPAYATHGSHTHTHQSSGGGSALSSWAREFARRAVKTEVCIGCGCLVELESANKKVA